MNQPISVLAMDAVRDAVETRFDGNIAEASRAWGVKNDNLHKWLRGDRAPKLEQIGPVLDRLGISLAVPGLELDGFDLVRKVAAVAGCGESLETEDGTLGWYAFRREFFRRLNINARACVLMTARGDSMMPLLFLVIACVLNIFLDLAFVNSMGVAGVALATIIAQGVSAVLCLWRLCHIRHICDVKVQHIIHPDKPLMLKIGALGLPSGITQAIFSMSAIIVQSLTNTLGDAMVAANTAIMRVDGFAMMPNFTFGTAATTYIGQNVGAGRGDRLKPGLKAMLLLGLLSSTVLVAAILLFGHHIIGWFTETELTIQLGVQGLQTLAFGYICFSVSQVLQGTMRGAGETQIPMWISIICTVILRMPLAYLMAYLTRNEQWPNGQPAALFVSLLICWVVGTILSIVSYKLKFWRKKLGTLGDEI